MIEVGHNSGPAEAAFLPPARFSQPAITGTPFSPRSLFRFTDLTARRTHCDSKGTTHAATQHTPLQPYFPISTTSLSRTNSILCVHFIRKDGERSPPCRYRPFHNLFASSDELDSTIQEARESARNRRSNIHWLRAGLIQTRHRDLFSTSRRSSTPVGQPSQVLPWREIRTAWAPMRMPTFWFPFVVFSRRMPRIVISSVFP